MKQRVLAAALSLVMAVSLLPMSVLAAGTALPITAQKTAKSNGDRTYTIQLTAKGSQESQSAPVRADVVLVVDNSGSMGVSHNRLTAAQNASQLFADSILQRGAENRMGVVGFNNIVEVSQALTTDREKIRTAISSMAAMSSTNYAAAMAEAWKILSQRTDQSRPAYVVFLSDGVPNKDMDGSAQVAQMKAKGVLFYTVGIAINDGDGGDLKLKEIASQPLAEYNVNVTDSDLEQKLQNILNKWAGEIVYVVAGTQAVMTDVINNDRFEYVPSSAQTNYGAISVQGGKTVTWNIGVLNDTQGTATFKVRLKSGATGVPGGILTNENVSLSYVDPQNQKQTLNKTKIGDPKVPVYTVIYQDGTSVLQTNNNLIPGEGVPSYTGTLSKDGYTFVKWNVTSAIRPAAGNKIPSGSGGTLTYTAQWKKNAPEKVNYTVQHYTVDADGKETLYDTDTKTGLPGTAIDVKACKQTIQGYIFTGAKPENAVIDPSGQTVLKLYYDLDQWKDGDQVDPNGTDSLTGGDGIPDKYQTAVQFVSADQKQGTVTGKTLQIFTFANEQTSGTITPVKSAVKITPASGYEFGRWTQGTVNNVDPFQAKQSQGGAIVTYTAQWGKKAPEKANYTIQHYTVDVNGKETLYDTDTKTGLPGTAIDVKACKQTIQGYIFTGAKPDNAVIDPSGQTVLKLYYDLDQWKDGDQVDPNGTDSLTGGDGIPDKYQTAVQFVSADQKQGTVTGKTLQIFTFANEQTSGTITPVQNSVTTAPAGGYQFSRWTKDNEQEVNPFQATEAKGGTMVIYTARWHCVTKPVTRYYTLTYDSQGGTPYAPKTYSSGTVVTLDQVPIREGYTFTGWYDSPEKTHPLNTIRMNGNKTVYAGWMKTEVPPALDGADHIAYVIGYPDGTVRPKNQISRAEVAAIFFRLLKDEVRDGNLTQENGFKDVSTGNWFLTPVSTMAKLGLVNGRTADAFVPNASITRAEFAVICARFDQSTVTGTGTFSDIQGHWAKLEIERAAALGWILGYDDGTFQPDQCITRAEAMTMINRVLSRLPETAQDLLPGMRVWRDNPVGAWYYLAVQEATNSHDHKQKTETYETWTKLNADPDWGRYEQ